MRIQMANRLSTTDRRTLYRNGKISEWNGKKSIKQMPDNTPNAPVPLPSLTVKQLADYLNV